MQRFTAVCFLIISVPFILLIFLAVKLTSSGPFLFKQKRAGKNMKVFTIYKIRSMVVDAELLKKKYLKLNEAESPVFKIRNDPRYTKIGRFLAFYGLDELPQLINIIKGEMAFVGPRPLSLDEAQKIPEKYRLRLSVLPGLTSPWVVSGAHKLSFQEWMESDLEYIRNKSFWYDCKIVFLTICKIFFRAYQIDYK